MTDRIESAAERWKKEDKEIVDRTIKLVLETYQSPPTQAYVRIPLRELVEYTLQNENVPGHRIPKLTEEVYSFFKKIRDQVNLDEKDEKLRQTSAEK